MLKRCYLKPITIKIVVLLFVLLTFAQVQSDTFASEKGTAWVVNSSNEKDSSVNIKGYMRVAGTLLIVIALVFATVFVLKRKYGIKTSMRGVKKHMKVIDHIPLGMKKSLFMVKVPGKHLLIGVTNDRIKLVAEISNEDIECTGESSNKNEFLDLMKKSYLEHKQK